MLRHIFAAGFLALAMPAMAQIQSPRALPVTTEAVFPGVMKLSVDATDITRGIFNVQQTIPLRKSGPTTVLLPAWLPGNHAPRGQIEKIAGLVIKAGGKTLMWKRDPRDVFAFTVDVPEGSKQLDVRFQFVSATAEDQGRIVMTDAMMNIQWHSVSLYPAGYATRDIPISATVTYPAGWKAATALRAANTSGDAITYQTVDYETLVDSPVFAGKHFRSEPLGHGVALNIVADEAKFLAAKPQHIDAHKKLVDQAVKLFGSKPFDHYDFLLALTDKMGSIGLEHHRSSENGVNPEYFTDWESGPGRRNLLPHEFAHSWSGKYRRPAGQMVDDFRTPLVNDLLWVYEGQDQFWGYVLGARSGMFSKQETLDALASIAAGLDIRRGRDWRSLDDTTNDPVITARRPKGWVSFQRSEDYYNEGLLIWLEVDGLLRQQTRGAKGMDDFAKIFFGGKDGDYKAKPFTFEEVAQTLGKVSAFDWSGFLQKRLTEKASGAPLGGLTLGGYKLVYSETPSAFTKDTEKNGKFTDFTYSLGMTVNKSAKITNVIWDGPAFNAGLTVGAEIVAVNGRVYSDTALKDAVTAAKGGKEPIKLIVKSGALVREMAINWNGGLRYPRLEKTAAADGSLDALLAPRP
jgi:predicted metalloprotease with PDZ domain